MTVLGYVAPRPKKWPLRRLAGLAILAALLVFALLPLVIGGPDPLKQTLRLALKGPSAADWFGYDHLGRSMYARLTAAFRLSLGLAGVAVVTAIVPGVLLGVLAAWRGGVIDRIVSTVSEAFLALPGLLLVLMLAAIVPDQPIMLYVGISLVLWVEYFRITRALARPLLASPAIEASRLLGFGPLYIIRRHLWPEIAPILLTVGAHGAATAIMAVAALGFVSVGVRPPTPELGAMMTELLPYYEEAPHALLQPIAATFLMVLALQLIAGKDKP
ncbi:ABC transporter permease [Sinorhizobium numidicum]|uniref:ABC transporter permease n=1 Tax=Sinorhizobium numidicum TaxID=680248 RepID=A0ABY8CN85_9HYPH|nr:ABC transporter permease [Sinorhizobium numidicum]WEX74134.1 ABC transporter permease [Sinorhizobium numidicum]WEX80119.1 ABC transporter permease [Sinorhizobium numidicum]